MPAFLGLAVQSDVRCASGVTVTYFRPEDLVACTAVLSPTEPETLSVTLPRSDARAAECTPGRVLRTCFQGGTADREWDIADVQDGATADLIVITAQPIALRLARAIYVGANSATGAPEFAFSEASRSISAILDALVIPACDAAGLTWVERGTVDSTALVDLSGEWASALEIVQALVASGRGSGEWQLRRNGDTDYRLDLVDAIGESAATARVRTALNLLDNRRTREIYETATRLYPRGSSDGNQRTIADHLWRVKTVVDAAWLELEDISGGAGPLAYDDQLNGLYLAVLNSHTFASHAITDSVAATQRVQVSSTTGISAGQWCRVFKGSGANGARVTSLHRPSAALTPANGGLGDRGMVLDLPALRGDANLVPNPWMRAYASASDAPDSWTDTAGTPANRTVAREATLVRDGTEYSCRFTTTGTTTLSLETPDIRAWAIAERRHFAALWFNVQAIPADPASAVILELITSGGTLIQEIGRWVRGSDPLLDTWIRLITDPVLDLSTITSAVRLRARVARTNNASAESGWDIVFGPALLAESEVAVTDIEYSGGTKLWQEANVALARVSSAIRGYDLRLLDLERNDATTYADFALTPGGTVEITDSDLGETVSLRLTEYRPDYLNPLESQLRVGVTAATLTGLGEEGLTPVTVTPASDRLVYTQCEARQSASAPTQIEVTVTASAAIGTPAVRLVALTGTATIASGAAIGVLAASGAVWTFNRGAFEDGPSQAVFEAVLNGAITDADLIVLPEQGRDTVPLQVRARVVTTDADEIVVRVAVADPFPGFYADIDYSAEGLTGVTPAAPVSVLPAATLTEAAGTYEDFTVPRPASGSPPGRITFSVTAIGRTGDGDAVDVPAQNPAPASLDVSSVVNDEDVEITWDVGTADTAELRIDGGSWATPGSSPITVPRDGYEGGSDHTYTFRSTGAGGDVKTAEVLVPRQLPYVGSPPTLTISSIVRDSATAFTTTWSVANMPGGVTYNIAWRVFDVGSGTGSTTGVSSPHQVTTVTGTGTGSLVRVTVTAKDTLGNTVASHTLSVTF